MAKEGNKELSQEERKALAAEQIAIDRHHLLLKMPFIGSLLMRLDPVPVSDCRLETASTDGDHIFVDIDFYSKLTKEERMFVLAHEAWHCALLHFARRQDREHERFNCAADLEIHFILMDENELEEPFVLPHKLEWKGLSAEEIYERYPDPPKKNYMGYGKESANIKGTRADGGFDRHEEPKQNDSAKQDGKGFDPDENPGQNDSAKQDGKGIDPNYVSGFNPEAVERNRERVASAVQQYKRCKGSLPGTLADIIDKILTPEINWRELLAQFVTSCYGGSRQWLPPARRYVWRGLYLQGMRQQKLSACVAVDTSGSTTADLPGFFAEISGLLNSFGRFELTLIQCDASVQHVEHFDDTAPVPADHEWQVCGGGGTDFRPVFEYVEKQAEQPDLLIYLTDGYGDFPEHAPVYPVLWLLTDDSDVQVPWGISCKFPDKQRQQ